MGIYHLSSLFIISTLTVILVSAYPKARIINPDTVMRYSVGRRVTLRCSVSGNPRAVVWVNLDKNITVSINRTMYYSDNDRFYMQSRQMNSRSYWNLVITRLKKEDDGYYRCSIEPNGEQMVVRLIVLQAEILPRPPPVNTDYTACCKKANVAASCLKYCAMNVTDDYSLFMSCRTYLKQILQCAADGRNHVSCCLRRDMAAKCTPMCVNPAYFDLTSCLPQFDTAMRCFAEGKGSIPTSPSKVSVFSEYDYLVVKWGIPKENAEMVTNYSVMYREVSQAVYNVSSMLSAKTYWYSIQTGVTYKTYQVTVVAMSNYGTSIPSPATIITQGIGSPGNKENMTVSQCCSIYKVKDSCRKLCASNGFQQLEATDLVTCASDLKIALNCLSGGRNHTPCCLASNVPKYCMPLCGGGGELPFDWSLSQCYLRLPAIAACRDEGMGTLPGSPMSVALTQVTDTQAVITWQENVMSSAKSDEYNIIYNIVGSSSESMTTVLTTKTVLIDLRPQTTYAVVVVAVNKDGSSMPSPKLVFVTASKTPVPKKRSWTETYNETACCEKKGVPRFCTRFCDYEADITRMFTLNITAALQCEDYLIDMLSCVSDGRNHTGCCERSGVNPVCYHFCAITDNTRLESKDLVCNFQASKLLKCFVQGQDILPQAPVNITVIRITESSIELSWDPPIRGPTPTSYIVEYMPYRYDQSAVATATSNITLLVLQPLKASTTYRIKIMSSMENGTSLPSLTIISRTRYSTHTTPRPPSTGSGNTSYTTHAPLPLNSNDCCKKYVTNQKCVKYCLLGIYTKDKTCSEYILTTMACHAGGRDHRGCCMNAWVPETCADSCRGKILPNTLNTAKCVAYFDTVMACSVNGSNVPQKPTGFHIVNYTDQSITTDWEGVSGVSYIVRWQTIDRDGGPTGLVNFFTASNPPYTISGLKASTRYKVEVIAKNEYGSSQATSTQIVWTKDALVTVDIAVKPNIKIFDIKQSVAMRCTLQSPAQKRYDFIWYRYTRSHSLSSTNTLTIKSIDADSEGLYTCVVMGGPGNVYTGDYYLHVRRKPVVLSATDDFQPINSHAVLECSFSGFPDRVKWTKDGTKLNKEIKVDETTSRTSGKLVSTITIDNLQKESFGLYACNGTNRYGYAVGHASVLRLDENQPTTVPPVTFPSATKAPSLPDDVLECCQSLKVPKLCQSSCSLDLDIHQIFRNVNKSLCLGHINNLIRCAAAERNLTQCCSRRGVPSLCHSYCHGTTPDNILDSPELLKCISSADTIFACLKEGRNLVPTPPLGMAASYNYKDNTIEVTWLPPAKVGSGVSVYEVNYAVATSTTKYSINDQSYTIHEVLRNEVYKIWVVARNKHGHSHSSRTIYVKTSAGKPDVWFKTTVIPGVPSTPKVKLSVVNDLYIKVSWTIPLATIPYTYIILGYKNVNDKHFQSIKIEVSAVSHSLGPLDAQSRYVVYVAAGNSNGESRSDAVYIATKGKQVKALHSAQGPKSTVGIGLGVGLTIAVIAIVAAGAVVYHWRMKRAKSEERVTFENPSYSDTNQPVKIPGLAKNQDSVRSDKQFQYDTLADDSIVDPEYQNLEFTPPCSTKKDIDNNNSIA